MTVLAYRDWIQHLKHGSVSGIPRDLTLHGMHKFSHKYGTNSDISQLASPKNVRDATGLRDEPTELQRPGEILVIDCMQSDYNLRDAKSQDNNNPTDTVRETTKKLPTHGGAIAAAVCVDKYTSFVMIQLLKSVANPEVFVNWFFEEYRRLGHTIGGLAADQGILTNPMFSVHQPAVDMLCRQWQIKTVLRALPYNHARLTGSVEIEIQMIKQSND